MIIQSSNVQMSAEHEKSERISLNTSFESKMGRMDFSQLVADAGFSFDNSDLFTGQFDLGQAQPVSAGNGTDEDGTTPSILVMTDKGLEFNTQDKDKALARQQEVTHDRLFRGLMEAISGRKLPAAEVASEELPDVPEGLKTAAGEGQLPEFKPMTIEMSFSVTETIEEYESCSFHSCGMVKTADGREIEFGMDLQMERSYSATRTIEVTKQVVFTDPLVINYGGDAADLTDEKFSFDLDADGDEELISFFRNSGMLALDKNNDGVINDGTELFGALSGNGFADLAQYDEDGNNYIDEADSIFNELKVWTKTLDGDKLESLADKDIGAIYLGATETPFDIKGEDNQHNGRVRASGFYLTESGNVGTMQQVDMVV